MEYTIVSHDMVCGWYSAPMNKQDMEGFGVPWYCPDCDGRVVKFVRGTLEELDEWQREQAALKEKK